jgi:hypothetical protein
MLVYDTDHNRTHLATHHHGPREHHDALSNHHLLENDLPVVHSLVVE